MGLMFSFSEAHSHPALFGQVFAQPSSLSHGFLRHGLSHLVPGNGIVDQIGWNFVERHPLLFGDWSIDFLVQIVFVDL